MSGSENLELASLKHKKLFLAHSNVGSHLKGWHQRREDSARALGYDLTTFGMSEVYPYSIFPRIDRRWKKRDAALLKFYDELGEKIDQCDVFIHYNGANIHPEFLEQFDCLKIYHCADDPDASKNISQPVAMAYDICAISNPACIPMYREWGCRNIFFWPIGAYHYIDGAEHEALSRNDHNRDIPISFVGGKYGVTRMRYVHRVPVLNRTSLIYYKKAFFEKIEREFPELHAYGSKWARGYIADDQVSDLYVRSQLGINVHNSLGPVNARLYELAAFGICQICDNRSHLHHVFEIDKEIIGFESLEECIDRIHYYLERPEQSRAIGHAARKRYLRDYTIENIWQNFVSNVEAQLRNSP